AEGDTEVIPPRQRGPRRSIVGVEPDGAFEHRERLLVRLEVAREGQAAEIEVIGLGVLRACPGVGSRRRAAEEWKESVAKASGYPLAKPDQVACGGAGGIAPEQAVRLRVHNLERDAQLVALLLEVSREHVGHAQLPASGLGID